MHEIDIATITKRSIQGITALTSRTFFVQFFGQAVTFLLTVYLSPSEYGLFFLVSSVILFYSYFADIGLAAALIQKKDRISKEDLQTTFTIQQALVVSIILIGFLITPWISKFYSLDKNGVVLYYSLLISFFLSSLKTIPSILLERNLHFKKLIIPEIFEVMSFNICALILAINGYGVLSFAVAVLARGIVGTIAIYIIQPWEVGIGFSRKVAKGLLSFGLPFQANSILALVKDQLLILYLGAVLPKQALGYIGFAQKWAFMPLRLVMDNVIRITFPSFSRLANEESALAKGIEKSLFAIMLFIFPIVTGISLLMPNLLAIVPRYNKWEPAVVAVIFFGINAILSSISTPLINALNATGRIKTTLGFMIFWTIATWVVTPIAISLFGFSGVAIAAAVISFSVVAVIYVSKKYIDFKFLPSFLPPFISTVVMGVLLYVILPLVTNIPSLIFATLYSVVIYSLTIFIIAKKQIVADLKLVRMQFQKH